MPNHTPPRHFLVFVPGTMGSRLRSRSTGELVWIDFPPLFATPSELSQALDKLLERLRYPNDDLEPAGIVDEIIFAPLLFQQLPYRRLLAHLTDLGYDLDPQAPDQERPPLYTFAYDWRQDNRLSGRQLGEAVDGWRAQNPGAEVWLLGHSSGGMVARWYVEKEGGKEHTTRLFLLGSPWDGAPKALHVIRSGFDVLFTRLLNLFDIPQKTRDVIRTFPSIYQLVPQHKAFMKDVNGLDVDPFKNTGWLDTTHERQLLLEGRQFNQELGAGLSIDTYCFFGTRQRTASTGLVRFAAGGRWSDINWEANDAGDGTVPEYSAVHNQAGEQLPFAAGHGDIHVAEAVLDRLTWELVHKYDVGFPARVEEERLHVGFETATDIYAPGEMITVAATVHNSERSSPIGDAEVLVCLRWQEALPYQPPPNPHPPAVTQSLAMTSLGLYEGILTAPGVAGYYQLEATVTAPGKETLRLEELLLIEAAPSWETLEAAIKVERGAGPLEEAPGDHLPPLEEAGSSASETAGADDEVELSIPPDFVFGAMGSGSRTGAEFERSEVPPGGGSRRTAREDEELSAELPLTGGGSDEAEAVAPGTSRWIDADIADHDRDEPLQLGEIYTLAFGIDTEPGAVSTLLDSGRVFSPGERLVELTAILHSDDFHVYTLEPQRIFLPSSGKSKNKARFDIEPRQAGDGAVSVAFYKYNNFIQDMTLRLRVGGAGGAFVGQPESTGRGPDLAFPVQPRDLSLVIKGQGPFDVTLVDTGVATATLNLTLTELDTHIAALRDALHEIVFFPYGCSDCYVYQEKVQIPEEVHREALKKLATAGYLLFRRIFYSPANEAGARLIGDRLRELARQQTLKIQIVSDRFLLPWGALYLEKPDPTGEIDPGAFLGFRHILEQIPLQQNVTVLEPNILSQPELAVSVSFNADIDAEMSLGVIAEQQRYWEGLGQAGATVAVADSADRLLERLEEETAADQILYFYCHAGGGRPDQGQNSVYLGLGGGQKITLDELELRLAERRFAGSPLVFVNACETADLSPFFYSGFMPFFTERGARGFIGTECEVPAVFAAAWARAFFDLFLAGNRSLGETFLALRRRFLLQDNNLLGLLYALYCDGDMRVLPGVALTTAPPEPAGDQDGP